jgi:DNA gyrase subunit A
VVVRRATYDLAQARARAHLLQGFAIALDNLDEVIAIIRGSESTAAARTELIARFELSELQANAILDMRLRSLTQMEAQRVRDELEEVLARIADLDDLLASDERILDVIVEELQEIREKYGDERRTVIGPAVEGIDTEDLIVEEDMVVTVSHYGYIKRNPLTQYRAQRRGGKGVKGMDAREEDFVERLFVASTHAYILFFTTRGRVHWLKVHELPQLGRAARGRSLSNVLQLAENERVQATLPVRSFEGADGEYVILGTRKGVVKKTQLSAYSNPRRGGIIAINLSDDDELIAAIRTNGGQEVLIASKNGKSIRFPEDQVRPMGRTAAGVRGMGLGVGDEVVGMEILSPGATILTVTEKGYGKRTPLDEYRLQKRGGQGVITIRTTTRNGKVMRAVQVVDDDEVMLITDGGKVLRCPVSGISTMGRATQGVRVMDLKTGESLVSMARLAESDVSDGEGGSGSS